MSITVSDQRLDDVRAAVSRIEHKVFEVWALVLFHLAVTIITAAILVFHALGR